MACHYLQVFIGINLGNSVRYPLMYESYIFPKSAEVVGWLIAVGPLVLGLLLGALHALFTAKGRTIGQV